MNSLVRNISVALVALTIGLSATSAHAGFFRDAVKGVAKVGKNVIFQASGASAVVAGASAGAYQRCLANVNTNAYCDKHWRDYAK